jgi:hypothetical protein
MSALPSSSSEQPPIDLSTPPSSPPKQVCAGEDQGDVHASNHPTSVLPDVSGLSMLEAPAPSTFLTSEDPVQHSQATYYDLGPEDVSPERSHPGVGASGIAIDPDDFSEDPGHPGYPWVRHVEGGSTIEIPDNQGVFRPATFVRFGLLDGEPTIWGTEGGQGRSHSTPNPSMPSHPISPPPTSSTTPICDVSTPTSSSSEESSGPSKSWGTSVSLRNYIACNAPTPKKGASKTGRGSSTTKRVDWSGRERSTTPEPTRSPKESRRSGEDSEPRRSVRASPPSSTRGCTWERDPHGSKTRSSSVSPSHDETMAPGCSPRTPHTWAQLDESLEEPPVSKKRAPPIAVPRRGWVGPAQRGG